MSIRTEKISATIRKALQEAIARGVHDPRVRGIITVTAVEVSPDLRSAIVRVSVLPESAQELTLHGLISAAGRLRREVGEAVRMKRVPDLTFQLDDSLKRQAKVLSAIARAREQQAASAHGPPTPPGDTGADATDPANPGDSAGPSDLHDSDPSTPDAPGWRRSGGPREAPQ